MGKSKSGVMGWFTSPFGIIVLLVLFFMAMSNSGVLFILTIVAIGYFCIRFTAAGGLVGYRKNQPRNTVHIHDHERRRGVRSKNKDVNTSGKK